MERLSYGMTQHECPALSRTILVPLGVEKYSSKVIVSARCQICNAVVLEKTLDRSNAPTKGSYIMTA